jgi:hypothetical protein
MNPRLMCGGLTGRVYVVTRYTEEPDGTLTASAKYDVTEDFKRVVFEYLEHYRIIGPDGRVADISEVKS